MLSASRGQLPVAAWLVFDPGSGRFDPVALTVVYIALPVAVKVIAALLIWFVRIESERPAVRYAFRGH